MTINPRTAAADLTIATWRDHLRAAIGRKAAQCGADVSALRIDLCVTDAEDGSRYGLVFHGARPDVCERAARFFAAWAATHLRDLGVVGGHGAQESIEYVGEMAFAPGAGSASASADWHRAGTVAEETVYYGCGEDGYGDDPPARGWATSYVYHPGIFVD
jgi:hypothetical protein